MRSENFCNKKRKSVNKSQHICGFISIHLMCNTPVKSALKFHDCSTLNCGSSIIHFISRWWSQITPEAPLGQSNRKVWISLQDLALTNCPRCAPTKCASSTIEKWQVEAIPKSGSCLKTYETRLATRKVPEALQCVAKHHFLNPSLKSSPKFCDGSMNTITVVSCDNKCTRQPRIDYIGILGQFFRVVCSETSRSESEKCEISMLKQIFMKIARRHFTRPQRTLISRKASAYHDVKTFLETL